MVSIPVWNWVMMVIFRWRHSDREHFDLVSGQSDEAILLAIIRTIISLRLPAWGLPRIPRVAECFLTI